MPDAVEAGEPVTVTVRVEGYSGAVSQPIPFDGVLLIDQSGSMDTEDPQDKRIDAAESFVDCVAPATRLAVVTFANSADEKQALTSDSSLLHTALDDLRGDEGGETRMYSGMAMAQNILIADSLANRERFIILLTDGVDTSGHTDADFLALAQLAADNDIVYHAIALGNQADFARLYMIADITEGQAYLSPSASDLEALYDDICQTTSIQARTREVVLEERINISGQPPVYVVPGSVSSSVASLDASQIQQFETGGQIDVAMEALASGQEETLTFQVASDCLTPDAEPGAQVDVAIDDASSRVTYTYGLSQGSVPVPQATFTCFAPGEFEVDKTFNPGTMELKLTLENKWSPDPDGVHDNSLRDLLIIEQPSVNFEPDFSQISPPPAYRIPGPTTDVVVWRLSALAPKAKEELTVQVSSRVCSETYRPPIPVDAEKDPGLGYESHAYYTSPRGGRKDFPIEQERTTLTLPEQCTGRHDLYIEPAQDLGDFKVEHGLSPPPASLPGHMLWKHESHAIWVDSEVGNGLWNGTDENIADYVDGALSGEDVPGQGDLLHSAAKNIVYVGVTNMGTLASPGLPDGLTLSAFNNTSQHWEELASRATDVLDSERGKYFGVEVMPNSINSQHIATYRLALDDFLHLMRQVDPSLNYRIRVWLQDHPDVRSALIAQGPLAPDDILQVLPAPCDCAWYEFGCWLACWLSGEDEDLAEDFQAFLDANPDLAWGKPSVRLLANARVLAPEKHGNNNVATEVVIVGSQ